MMRKPCTKPAWGMWLRWALLAALLITAAWLWRIDGQREKQERALPNATPSATAQSDMRLKRETAYDRDVAALQALLESGAADRSTQEMAADRLSKMIAEHQNEIALETALEKAGFASVVVIAQNGAVTVMIPPEALNETSSAQILTLCVAHTEAGAENVRIMDLPDGI